MGDLLPFRKPGIAPVPPVPGKERVRLGFAVSMSARPGAVSVVVGDLACRDRELANTRRALASTQRQLAHARVLLTKSREAIDLALEETQQEPEGG